ncbi:MAG: hypothetical protein IJR87_11560 [Bacteroidaceae bacterium]|nr:hypothetical protein [Bacteroidaceae bacterium]
MKRIIFLALSAMLLCLAASAQENFYVIDGQRVENFDGSQLVGKTVRHYEIKRLEHTTIHNIFTTDDWVKIENASTATTVRALTAEEAAAEGVPLASGKVKAFMRNPLVVVDGQEFTGNIYKDIGTENIKSIDVYEADSEVAKSYGDKGKNGVVKIFTEKLPEAVTYFIDGKTASKTDFTKLRPDEIKVIKVLKRGSAAAIQASPDGNTNDIYQITTK